MVETPVALALGQSNQYCNKTGEVLIKTVMKKPKVRMRRTKYAHQLKDHKCHIKRELKMIQMKKVIMICFEGEE